MHTGPLIEQRRGTCYNCGKKDFTLVVLARNLEQQIWLAVSPELILKALWLRW